MTLRFNLIGEFFIDFIQHTFKANLLKLFLFLVVAFFDRDRLVLFLTLILTDLK